MKAVKFFIVIFLSIHFSTHAQSSKVSNRYSNDSLNAKANQLKRLYKLATSSSTGVSNIYKRQFFDAFPNTFKQLDELYGDNNDINNKPSLLNNQAEDHIIHLFNELTTINDTLYYKKIISIAKNGHWDADAINFFQHGLEQKVLKKPILVVYILKNMSDDNIYGFWHFYFDQPYPDKQVVEPLQKIKSINNKIYDLMIKAHNEILKQDK